ncbi:unnamed protein product [Urochloa humidicola]
MATKARSLLRAACKASLASRAAAAAASRAARAADVAALSLAGTKASSLLRAVRRTSLASRAAAAAASRAAAAAASRAARAADVATDVAPVDRLSLEDLDLTKSCSNPRLPTLVEYAHLPEDSKTPTDKDLESDAAVWALYERWCKAFNKKRDYAAMTYRFEIFRYNALWVYRWNNSVPADPKLAACLKRKRRKVKLLLSKGEDASHFENCYHPMILGPLADGGDPFLRQYDYDLLKHLGKGHARRAPKDDTVE